MKLATQFINELCRMSFYIYIYLYIIEQISKQLTLQEFIIGIGRRNLIIPDNRNSERFFKFLFFHLFITFIIFCITMFSIAEVYQTICALKIDADNTNTFDDVCIQDAFNKMFGCSVVCLRVARLILFIFYHPPNLIQIP